MCERLAVASSKGRTGIVAVHAMWKSLGGRTNCLMLFEGAPWPLGCNGALSACGNPRDCSATVSTRGEPRVRAIKDSHKRFEVAA